MGGDPFLGLCTGLGINEFIVNSIDKTAFHGETALFEQADNVAGRSRSLHLEMD